MRLVATRRRLRMRGAGAGHPAAQFDPSAVAPPMKGGGSSPHCTHKAAKLCVCPKTIWLVLPHRLGEGDSKDVDSSHDDQLDGAKDTCPHGARSADFSEVPFHDTPLFLQCDIVYVSKINLGSANGSSMSLQLSCQFPFDLNYTCVRFQPDVVKGLGGNAVHLRR